MDLIFGDVSQRVVVHERELAWTAAGERMSIKVLDRTSNEPPIRTTLIKLEPGCRLREHRHAIAEDVFCLSGSWFDDEGTYGPGSYLHSPAGSVHTPCSEEGSLLFVKTRVGPPGDVRIAIDTTRARWHPAQMPGMRIMMLHEHGLVRVALLSFPAGVRLDAHDHPEGEEFYVLDGAIEDEGGPYEKRCWVRQPPGSRHAVSSEHGATLLSVAGHLV